MGKPSQNTIKRAFAFGRAILLAAALFSAAPAWAAKWDNSSGKLVITDGSSGGSLSYLIDGYGAEPYPIAANAWTPTEPLSAKPAVAVFDYGRPVKVAVLVNHCWRPDCRDQRYANFVHGPASFKEVKIYTRDDGSTWSLRAHLRDLPPAAPQLLRIAEPVAARYLRLEVPALDPAAHVLQTYEFTTYVDEVPASLPSGDEGKARPAGFPNKSALEPARVAGTAGLEFDASAKTIKFRNGALGGKIALWADDQAIAWDGVDEKGNGLVTVRGARVTVAPRLVKAGLLLNFTWAGPATPPYPRLDVVFQPDFELKEWCVPAYSYTREAPRPRVTVPNPAISTRAAMAGDLRRTLTVVPGGDQGWVGIHDSGPMASFALRPDLPHQILLLATDGDWYSGFEKAVADVFDFQPPRQFSPVSTAVPQICRFLMDDRLWSEKYQMLRSFPDTDFFYIFYSLPYAIPALSAWETMSGDPKAREKVDKILKFTLGLRYPDGPMKGAIHSEYADYDLVVKGHVPYCNMAFLQWYKNFPRTDLVGMDQGANRWVTSHTGGGVLWAVTQVWMARGRLDPAIEAAAREVADWMVGHQDPDGGWPYAFTPEGEKVAPITGSGSIWNVWALYRFGKLTGEAKYAEAARRGADYFKRTFTANHMYRGYWEDNLGGFYQENKKLEQLNTAQGYESSVAAAAFAEMGENDALASSARDAQRFICTRVLESRSYFTSYGGASEQQGWAPGTYIAPTFGYASWLAWRRFPREDIFRRFSGSAMTIGWWQDPATGGAFWLSEAITQNPIDMFREKGGGRQFWALWDSGHKVTFSVPWLLDQVNHRSGDRIKLDAVSLRGADDRGRKVQVTLAPEKVESASGQVNWVNLLIVDKAQKPTPREVALINHHEATTATITFKSADSVAGARLLTPDGKSKALKVNPAGAGKVSIALPADSLAIVEYTTAGEE